MSGYPKIVAFAGFKHSGKSTAAKLMKEGIKQHLFAFADRLKCTAREMFGLEDKYLWGEEKDEPLPEFGNKSGRDLIVWLGTVVREQLPVQFSESGGLWVHHFRKFVKKQDSLSTVLVEDCRYPDEVAAIRQYGGIIVVIEAPGDAKKREREKPVHSSEDVNAVIRAAGSDVIFVQNPKNNLNVFRENLRRALKNYLMYSENS